jgi:hypothetical protein
LLHLTFEFASTAECIQWKSYTMLQRFVSQISYNNGNVTT